MAEEFYAAFVEESRTIPGDERSRTNPGHGYPEHTETYTKVERFSNRLDMERWVQMRAKSVFSPKFQIVKCVPLEVRTSVTVSE